MEFQDVVRRRRMVRNYSDEPVDPAIVDRALANATRAPSAGFSQGWAFLVLDTPDDVRRFWAATADDLDEPDRWLTGMMRAPVVVVPCSSKARLPRRYAEADKGWADRDEARWPVPFWHMDAAMASLLILQTAVDGGWGVLLRRPAGARSPPCAPSSASPTTTTRSARSRSATGPEDAGPRARPAPAPAATSRARAPRPLD